MFVGLLLFIIFLAIILISIYLFLHYVIKTAVIDAIMEIRKKDEEKAKETKEKNL